MHFGSYGRWLEPVQGKVITSLTTLCWRYSKSSALVIEPSTTVLSAGPFNVTKQWTSVSSAQRYIWGWEEPQFKDVSCEWTQPFILLSAPSLLGQTSFFASFHPSKSCQESTALQAHTLPCTQWSQSSTSHFSLLQPSSAFYMRS